MTLSELLPMYETLRRETGPALIRYREERGLTQGQLAERLRVSRRHVVRLEKGEVVSRCVLRLLEAL